ncbi:MAG: hypothetical protein JO001_20885 [Alphaproteobacteria bacterium]|nr:hypothetical protein [Alphaproteobacteria bacterium]
MKRLALTAGIVSVLGIATILGSCSALDPYPTTPRAPATPPAGIPAAALKASPPLPRVGICYNTLTTTLAEVQAQAQQECGPKTQPEPASTDWYLQYCPVLLPARATFVCKATP